MKNFFVTDWVQMVCLNNNWILFRKVFFQYLFWGQQLVSWEKQLKPFIIVPLLFLHIDEKRGCYNCTHWNTYEYKCWKQDFMKQAFYCSFGTGPISEPWWPRAQNDHYSNCITVRTKIKINRGRIETVYKKMFLVYT